MYKNLNKKGCIFLAKTVDASLLLAVHIMQCIPSLSTSVSPFVPSGLVTKERKDSVSQNLVYLFLHMATASN